MVQKLRTPVHLMNDQQKEWFALALISMILSDGNITSGETNHLLQSISFVREKDAVERLKKYVQFKAPPTLHSFKGWEQDPKNKALMMLDLMDSAVSDSDLSPKEREQIHIIGSMLGFQARKVDELIAMKEKALGTVAES